MMERGAVQKPQAVRQTRHLMAAWTECWRATEGATEATEVAAMT